MKKNKGVIIICTILIAIMIGQIIYFKLIRKKEDNITNDVVEEPAEGIISNIDDLYRLYPDIPISSEKLEQKIYRLITENFPRIHDMTKNNNSYENKNIYEENKEEINEMGIETSNDFILIAEELKYVLSENSTAVTSISLEIDEEQASSLNEGYRFDIIIEYSNNSQSNIRCAVKPTPKGTTTENDIKITYSSCSQIAELLSDNRLKAGAEDILATLSNFTQNIKTLCKVNELKSANQQAQYYNLNENVLNNMGIYSGKDMQNILISASNNIGWYEAQRFDYYTIDIKNATQNENYIKYKVEFIYDFAEKFETNIEIRTKQNVEPPVKLTGTEA